MKLFNTTLALICLAAAQPALAAPVDTCLIGLWHADLDDFNQVYIDQMGADSATSSGVIGLRIGADNVGELGVVDLTIDVAMPSIPPMKVSINGNTVFAIDANDGAFTMEMSTYSYMASADVMGSRMDIPLSSADGMFGAESGTYSCSDTLATFTIPGDTPKLPRRWHRVAE